MGEIEDLEERVDKIRNNEIKHLQSRVSDLENIKTYPLKSLPAVAITTIISIYGLEYGFTNNVYSIIIGSLGLLIITFYLAWEAST